jgi:DNA processing protein
VEAARRSGSLITARYALEQGREVFAVPGSPLDPRAEGTNDLIREGATLCAAPEHVLSALEPTGTQRFSPLTSGEAADGDGPEADGLSDGPEGGDVAALLGPAPVSIDDLARQSGLPIRSVRQALLELELAGRLERHANHAVSLLVA